MAHALAPDDYVEIGRRFLPFDRLGAPNADDMWAEILASRQEKRDWDWLLSHHVIALLAEAGSGKSYEFRAQVDRLVRAGHPAFYFRVERLCNGAIEDAFETSDQAASFRAWKESGTAAVFFLDSVDEAKLPKGEKSEPLRDALNALEREIGSRLGRAKLVVSCRGSEWYSETEQVHLRSFASRLADAIQPQGLQRDDPKLLRSLSFAALDREQVTLLTAAQGETDGFLAALDEHQLWDEVRTPMDAVHLATTYFGNDDPEKLFSQLSSKSAVFDASVRRRLADRPDSRTRTDMLPTESLKVAQFLAFAATVSQVRDISFDAPVQGALDVRSLVEKGPVSATPLQLRQMLATPLFTPAGRGTVRFYRPEIEAMLAAQFLDSMRDHLPTTKVTKAFGSESFGLAFVAQPFGPMLSWLAALDPRVLRWLTSTAPEFLLEEGDPQALAVGDRIEALNRHVTETHKNLPGSFYFPNSALARFADAELESVVVDLLTAPALAREAKIHLLQIVRQGKYASAADWLSHVCGDGFTPSEIKIYAVRALVACGSEIHLQQTCEAMLAWGAPHFGTKHSDHLSQREDDARIHLIGAGYPDAISIDTMLRILAQVRGREFARDGEIFVAVAKRTGSADLPKLIEGLESLCWSDRPASYFGHRAPQQTSRANLLFDGLCSAIARLIVEKPEAIRVESIGWCFTTSRYSRLDRDKEEWGRIAKALQNSQGVRQRLICAAVSSDQKHHPLVGLHEMLSRAWKDSPENLSSDIEFCLREYTNSDPAARQVWADLLMRWVGPLSRSQQRQISFKLGNAAFRQGSGVDWPTLNALRWRPFSRIRRLWYRYTYGDWSHVRHKIRFAYRDVREKLAWDWSLARNWRSFSQGKRPFLAIHYIFGDRDDKFSRKELLEHKGQIWGRALIKAACKWASQISPNIAYRHEIVALNDAGFRWLFEEDRDFFQKLPLSVRKAAIQQDLWDSDESPAWATALPETHPDLWKEVAASVVTEELAKRARFEPQHSNTPLWKLQKFSATQQSIMAPTLLEWAENNATMSRVDIRPLAATVQSKPSLDPRLSSLARRATREAFHEGQWRRGLAWLEVWGQQDVAAIECLCDWLEGPWRGDEPCEYEALSTLGTLLGSRSDHGKVTIVPLPSVLRLRLANLVHDIAPLAEDEPSREGMQTVTPRRQMEEVRRVVESYLGSDYSPSGRDALVEFIGTRILPSYPQWAERWLASHAREAKKPKPWTVEEVSRFARLGSLPPSDGDGLLAHVVAEIDGICAALNESEFDRRALFNNVTSESDFRAWLGYELDRRLRGWASITQETVTRGEKRTDLRIELRGGDNAVLVVEIKLAHRWNRNVLLNKVKSQLVDQYLIGDKRVRHGLYLLVDFGIALKGSLEDGTQPDLAEFGGLLSEFAEELSGVDDRVVQYQQFSILKM